MWNKLINQTYQEKGKSLYIEKKVKCQDFKVKTFLQTEENC